MLPESSEFGKGLLNATGFGGEEDLVDQPLISVQKVPGRLNTPAHFIEIRPLASGGIKFRKAAGQIPDAEKIKFFPVEEIILLVLPDFENAAVILVDVLDQLRTFADPFGIDIQDFRHHGRENGQRNEAHEEFGADAHDGSGSLKSALGLETYGIIG